ncbi:hypothetical protein MMC28_010638 [Mycoblastus sanguinarius]|nr:hypothetical protein [Mycoblastus sanguinarius]
MAEMLLKKVFELLEGIDDFVDFVKEAENESQFPVGHPENPENITLDLTKTNVVQDTVGAEDGSKVGINDDQAGNLVTKGVIMKLW